MLACGVTGLALYLTRGVLDQTVTAAGVVRFAMLPPWQALVGFTCLAALALLVPVTHPAFHPAIRIGTPRSSPCAGDALKGARP